MVRRAHHEWVICKFHKLLSTFQGDICMSTHVANPRIPQAEVDAMFPDRWSPRSFLPDTIPDHQIQSLFEAARWAPSCFNEQPWRFVYATSQEDRARFSSALVERNQQWASHAPLLVFAACCKQFAKSGKTNRHAPFDTGAAWLSFALQARRLGLYAHAMAGFDIEKAFIVTVIPKERYDIYAAIAVGRLASPDTLAVAPAEIEKPNTRKPLTEIAFQNHFPVIET